MCTNEMNGDCKRGTKNRSKYTCPVFQYPVRSKHGMNKGTENKSLLLTTAN